MLKQYEKKQLIEFITGRAGSVSLSHQEELKLRALEREVQNGQPLEYITNSCDFLGCKLFINQDVLIPRCESEILAEIVINSIHQQEMSLKVLDLCTGSGAIGLSIKKHTNSLVTLTDICPRALNIAKSNVRNNGLDVELIQSDLFKSLGSKKFDIVVCNPPYISSKAYDKLMPSVKDYEPKHALVGGNTGLEFYENISKNIYKFLNPNAKVFFEIGYDQGSHVQKIFSDSFYIKKYVKKDYSGHDRFFFLEFQPALEVS